MRQRILAVIVLYRMAPSESRSLQSLLRAKEYVSPELLDLAIMLYDNSPAEQLHEDLPQGVHYYHAGSNRGLATAYNLSLSMALDRGYEWMMTLDQDTELPANALEILAEVVKKLSARPDVAAIVPQIRAGRHIVSPNYFAGGGWPRWFSKGYTGISEKTVFAFNSASLYRTSVLRQIGGYSPWFWLDNSDSYLFKKLSKFGKRVYVAGNLEVEHDFSMKAMQERISKERYESMLLAESAFWDQEMNCFAGLERTARLGARFLKQKLRGGRPDLRKITLEALLRRVFHSRKYRETLWRKATAARLGGTIQEWSAGGRPKVSVCMAAYNGERYVQEQLRSIVPQLTSEDEIVIVDDASRDGTREKIEELREKLEKSGGTGPRFVFSRHKNNLGVVSTFEDTLRAATGDILFLCDGDDLWDPERVRKISEVFSRNPETQVICTGLRLIDEDGRPVEWSSLMSHRKFSTTLIDNLLHNQFQGSALAFRASFLPYILPIPVNRIFLHDRWIGMRAITMGCAIQYVDEPLLLYRIHSGNFTRKLTKWKQIYLRLQLIAALLWRNMQRV